MHGVCGVLSVVFCGVCVGGGGYGAAPPPSPRMSGAAAAERGGRPGVADLFVSQEERISQFNYLLFFETLSRYEGGREEGGAPCRGGVNALAFSPALLRGGAGRAVA